MRILTVNYEYPPLGGGGGVAHALIAEELARRHEVHVITSTFRDLPRRERRRGVEIHRVPVVGRSDRAAASFASLLTFPPSAWLTAAQLLRRRRFDVVNGHFAVPTGPGSLLPAMLTRLPHVLTVHGGDIYDPSKRTSPHRLPPVRAIVDSVLRRSHAVVAQSRDTRANVYEYYRYDGPVELIPLGIRIPDIAPATRAELGLPDDAFLAVTVGRLVRRKAVDRLLDAMRRTDSPDVHLIVIGTGPELESLRSLARRFGIADRTRFTGWTEEQRKWQILHAADAYVSATMHEGFGLVYLEAMAAGLPVVTPGHGGQTDFLEDGVTGFLTPSDDTAALAAAVQRLLRDPEDAERMGAANKMRVQRYRIERCAAEYEALFERTVRDAARTNPRQPVSQDAQDA